MGSVEKRVEKRKRGDCTVFQHSDNSNSVVRDTSKSDKVKSAVLAKGSNEKPSKPIVLFSISNVHTMGQRFDTSADVGQCKFRDHLENRPRPGYMPEYSRFRVAASLCYNVATRIAQKSAPRAPLEYHMAVFSDYASGLVRTSCMSTSILKSSLLDQCNKMRTLTSFNMANFIDFVNRKKHSKEDLRHLVLVLDPTMVEECYLTLEENYFAQSNFIRYIGCPAQTAGCVPPVNLLSLIGSVQCHFVVLCCPHVESDEQQVIDKLQQAVTGTESSLQICYSVKAMKKVVQLVVSRIQKTVSPDVKPVTKDVNRNTIGLAIDTTAQEDKQVRSKDSIIANGNGRREMRQPSREDVRECVWFNIMKCHRLNPVVVFFNSCSRGSESGDLLYPYLVAYFDQEESSTGTFSFWTADWKWNTVQGKVDKKSRGFMSMLSKGLCSENLAGFCRLKVRVQTGFNREGQPTTVTSKTAKTSRQKLSKKRQNYRTKWAFLYPDVVKRNDATQSRALLLAVINDKSQRFLLSKLVNSVAEYDENVWRLAITSRLQNQPATRESQQNKMTSVIGWRTEDSTKTSLKLNRTVNKEQPKELLKEVRRLVAECKVLAVSPEWIVTMLTHFMSKAKSSSVQQAITKAISETRQAIPTAQ